MHPKTRKILYALRLRKILCGVFVKASEGMMAMLQKVEPYVTYGYVCLCLCYSLTILTSLDSSNYICHENVLCRIFSVKYVCVGEGNVRWKW